ncbi:MAG: hypothetical protein H0T15_02255 [Thermoleophilaceae bacterium]|nr:hypothetical protein [Thermoleophilaceae bacterium]
MWVEVVEETEAGFIGKLTNEPRTPGVVTPDTLVAFTPDDVAAVRDYWLRWPRALISRRDRPA